MKFIPGTDRDLARAIEEIRREFDDRLKLLERKGGRPGIVLDDTAAKIGEFLNIEGSSSETITIVLPEATQARRNARVTLAFRNENPVRIVAVNGTVNGLPFVLNDRPGTYDAICDGLGGWAVQVGVSEDGSGAGGGGGTTSADLAGLSLLGRAPNTFGPMAAITADTIRHVARDSDDGTFLEWGYPCALLHNGASLLVPEEFYSSMVLNSDWNMTQSPSALYVASLDKTFVAWCAVGLAGDKASQIAAFDHATETWSRRYNAGNYTLANDDHGHPALCRDADGYFHLFYGSHASTQHLSSSNAPNDITAWTQHAALSGTQTYPHPVVISGVIYLFLRNDAVSTRRQMLVRTATVAAGVPTFGASTNIIDFDADSRVYTSEAHVVGSDVHFACTRADGNDTARQHIYYFVYKTATGAVENHDGGVSVASGSLPVSLATANASFRLIDYGSDKGEVPSLAFDSSGNPHIQYIQGSDPTYSLLHIAKISGAWTSPATVASITDQVPGSGTGQGFVDIHGLVAGASGTMQSWYQNDDGDKLRRIRSAAGVWAEEELILAADTLRLMGQQAVRDADSSFRSLFSEVSTSSTDAGAVAGKRYAFGDDGPLNFAMPAAGSDDALWTSVPIMLGFEHRDGSTRIINESDSGAVVAAQSDAQVDTTQFKFGAASLLLDGTGDYLTLAHNALYSVTNGDFTVECWVRRNASKLHCIAAKRPSVGATEWAFYANATTNVLIAQAFSAGSLALNIAGTTGLTTGWHHVALARSGTTWRIFLDGALEASGTESPTPTGNSELLCIGRDQSNTARDWNGWIDEFRFTAGVARYTAAFTAPSAAFPRI